MLEYYEIHSRSAKKENRPMLIVSEANLMTIIEERSVEAAEVLSRDESGWAEATAQLIRQSEARMQKDAERSPELENFWKTISLLWESYRQEGIALGFIYGVFDPVFTLQQAFAYQEEANRMTEKFDIPREF